MPREQRIRRDNGPNGRERPPTERLGFRGQADALIVGESHPPGAELLPQHAVLSLEIVDDIKLLLEPAGEGGEEELQGSGRRRHGPAAIRHAGSVHPRFNNAQSDTDFRNIDLTDSTRSVPTIVGGKIVHDATSAHA
jgi:hypothetical protein